MLIILEGPDGSGKSTTAKILQERIPNSIVVRDPDYYRDEILYNKEISDYTRFYLYMAARIELITKQIKPALEQGKIVIADRLYISTRIYQGHIKGIDTDLIYKIEKMMMGGIDHELFFLDCSVESSLSRVKGDDVWEKEEFIKQMRGHYSKYYNEGIVIDSDNMTPDEMATRITFKLSMGEV
jgi:dTMP kinase